VSNQTEIERKDHDPGIVWARERKRHSFWESRKRRGHLFRESEPEVSNDDLQYQNSESAHDLERERYSGGNSNVRSRPRPGAEFAVPDMFDGEDVAPELFRHASARQIEQAQLLCREAAKLEEAGDKRRARSFRAKANRQALCGLIGRAKDCSSSKCGKNFFKPHDCRLRYCPVSGPKAFRQLFGKHMGRLSLVVGDLLKHGPEDCRKRVIAKIDITFRNTGQMPSPEQVRRFNQAIRRLFRRIERRQGISRRDYGLGWMDEFGSGNSNLHAHAVYVGPWIPQKLLSSLWQTITKTSFVISIKASPSFEHALSHALKYPSKFFDAAPSRLVSLEIVFHKVRRFHAMGRFYNPAETALEPGMQDGKCEANRCPYCGSSLRRSIRRRGWAWISDLEAEGRINLDQARVEANREKILNRAKGPP
jgi:hypothetical protein